MLVIGVDPGTAITGYGLVRENEDSSLSLVDYGAITTSPDQPMSQRLLELHHKLTDVLLLYHPQSGAVEKLFFQRTVRTAISVGLGRGVAILAMAQTGLPVAEYTPLQVKQAVAGYGKADKTQIQGMVRALLNLEYIPQPDDAADALAVAICHLHSQRMRSIYDQT